MISNVQALFIKKLMKVTQHFSLFLSLTLDVAGSSMTNFNIYHYDMKLPFSALVFHNESFCKEPAFKI